MSAALSLSWDAGPQICYPMPTRHADPAVTENLRWPEIADHRQSRTQALWSLARVYMFGSGLKWNTHSPLLSPLLSRFRACSVLSLSMTRPWPFFGPLFLATWSFVHCKPRSRHRLHGYKVLGHLTPVKIQYATLASFLPLFTQGIAATYFSPDNYRRSFARQVGRGLEQRNEQRVRFWYRDRKTTQDWCSLWLRGS